MTVANRSSKPKLVVATPDTQRRTAHEILEGVAKNAREELDRTTPALFISGLAGGMTMGLTGLGVAVAHTYLGFGGTREVLANLLYPLGFIAVVIGRAQLFTENTLYPVVLVLDERKHLLNTLRLWGTVLSANVLCALGFAVLAVLSGALRPESVKALVTVGLMSAQGSFGHLFWAGVIGGWLIALVAWMVTASHYTIGQIVVVYLLTYLVGLGHFAHCIATSGEILAAILAGATTPRNYLHWLAPATLGNIVGGVTIVSLLNYGQVVAGEDN
ncbi:MAG: formate/nitrite transporter family protein [Terriglobales bacterium]